MQGITLFPSKLWTKQKQYEAAEKAIQSMKKEVKEHDIIEAFEAPRQNNMKMMRNATGCSVEGTDILYACSSKNRTVILIDKFSVEGQMDYTILEWDKMLRVHTVDVGLLHGKMMKFLTHQVSFLQFSHIDKAEEIRELEKEIRQYDVNETAIDGDWKNGIMHEKFSVVTGWMKKHFKDLYEAARKMTMYTQPQIKCDQEDDDNTEPTFRIKQHRVCLYFKSKESNPKVNPEFKKKDVEELCLDLPDELYTQLQFTVEILVDDNPIAKITNLNRKLIAIPCNPMDTTKFEPHNSDPNDEDNSYKAYKASHPYTHGETP